MKSFMKIADVICLWLLTFMYFETVLCLFNNAKTFRYYPHEVDNCVYEHTKTCTFTK